MDYRLISTTSLLCIGVLVWIYVNKHMHIDYARHPQLINPANGNKIKPKDALQLSKIINYTQDYINSTNAQQRLYDLEYLLNFENPFLIDQSYSNPSDLSISGWPVANQTLCASHLHWILSRLDENKNYTYLRGQLGYELTSLIDSFGKPHSSFYSGSIHWLGSYKRCNSLSLNNNSIKTRYCIGRMRPQSWPKNETIHTKTRIRFGLCLPETCDTLSFASQRSLIERLAKYDLSDFYKSELHLESMFCLPDDRSPLRQIPMSGRVYLYVVGAWLTIVLVASLLYEIMIKRRKNLIDKKEIVQHTDELHCQMKVRKHSEEFLEALSLRYNLISFRRNNFKVKYNQGERVRVNLAAMNFFKVSMTGVIVLSHSGYLIINFTRTLSNRVDIATASSIARLALSAPRAVDTFFMFFGVLTTYTMMRKLNGKQLGSIVLWTVMNLGVLLRLAPLWALVYWYARSVSPYIGSGPWWDYGVDKLSMKGHCMSDAWWKSIPYFGSFGSLAFPSCLLPGWFLVSYSQISLILPPLTYIIYKLPNHVSRFFLVGFLLAASTLSVGHRLYNQISIPEEAFSMYGTFLVSLMENFESTGHMTTLSRLGSVASGCLVGYLLRMYDVGKIQKWPCWITSKWTVRSSAVSMILIVLFPVIAQLYPRSVGLGEFIAGDLLLGIIWPFLNAIMIIELAAVSNHRIFARFYSHTFWQVTNRLGLLMYLVHWEVLFVGVTGFEQAPSYGFIMDIFKIGCFGLIVSAIVALVLHLIVEAPLSNLIMIAFKEKLQAMSTSVKEEQVAVRMDEQIVRNG